MDKYEVAEAAQAKLKLSQHKRHMDILIEQQRWDETDAIAIGLAYLLRKDVEENEEYE